MTEGRVDVAQHEGACKCEVEHGAEWAVDAIHVVIISSTTQ
jgi:hypothetical protein